MNGKQQVEKYAELAMPAGYLTIAGVAVHIAEVRQYTADIHRFREYLPMAEEINQHEAGSPEWIGVIEQAPDPDSLADTVSELGAFMASCAEQLRAEAERRANHERE